MKDILDLIPEGSDIGVGLDIIKNNFHIFFLPGEKYILKENEMFYAGIGGHLEEGETLTKCAQREANEEVGVGVKLFSSSKTYYLPDKKDIQEIKVTNSPQPLALYEMIYPQGVQNQGESYYIVIYRAQFKEIPKCFKKDEVVGLVGLTEEQIIKNINRKPTLEELIEEGAITTGNIEDNIKNTIMYPIGTAKAIENILYKEKN